MTDENRSEVEELKDRVREKDVKVLSLISDGEDDVQNITSSTILTNSEVNYCFRKLENMDLITVSKPEGMVTRVVDGTKQVFEAPKQAQLTNQGEQFVEQIEEETGDRFEDLSRKELVRKVHRLEEEIEDLRNDFNTLQKQLQDHFFG